MFGKLLDMATLASLAIAIWTLKAVQSMLKPKYKVFSYEKIKKKKNISFIYIKEQLKLLVEDYRDTFNTKQDGLEEGIDNLENRANEWRIIIYEGKVIGFWLLYAMDDDTCEKMKKTSFTVNPDYYPCEDDKRSHGYGYLWMIGIVPEHMTYYGMKAICKGFLNFLFELACQGVYYDELFANPESSVGSVLVEEMGFKRSQEDEGEKPLYYHLELSDIDINRGIESAMNLGCRWEKYRIKKKYAKYFEGKTAGEEGETLK